MPPVFDVKCAPCRYPANASGACAWCPAGRFSCCGALGCGRAKERCVSPARGRPVATSASVSHHHCRLFDAPAPLPLLGSAQVPNGHS